MLLLCAVPASAAVISVRPGTTSVDVGGNVTFDIFVTDAADLFGFQFDLGFDATLVEALTVTEGSFLSGGGSTFFVPGDIDNVAGTLSFTANSLIGAIAGVSGEGVLATVSFATLSAGTSAISLFNVQLIDSMFADLPIEIVDATLTVAEGGGGSERVPEPGTLALAAVGGLALLGARRRRAGTRAA